MEKRLTPAKRSLRSHFFWASRVFFGVLILVVLFMLYLDLGQAKIMLASAQGMPLLLALGLGMANNLVKAGRFYFLINGPQKIVGLWDCFAINQVGVLLNNFLPGSSGDVLKFYYGYRRTGIREEMLTVSMMDKVLSLLTVFLVSLPFALIFNQPLYWLPCASLVAAITGGFLLLRYRSPQKIWLPSRLAQRICIDKLLAHFRLPWLALFCSGLASVLFWLVSALQMVAFLWTFGQTMNLAYLICVFPFIVLITNLPVSIGTWGSYEAALIFYFGLQGVEPTATLLVAIASRLLNFGIPSLWGMYFLLSADKPLAGQE